MNNKITKDFAKSIIEYNADSIIDIGETGIDTFIDESLIKVIPVLKTLYGLAKTGFAIRENHMLSKTVRFINYINSQKKDNEKFENYKKELRGNNDKRLKELERVLVIIDRYIDENKVDILSNLFISYFEEKITWEDFIELSIVIDNIFIKDINELKNIYINNSITMNQIIDSISFKRLKNQCLVDDAQSVRRHSNGSIGHYYNEYDYQITDLGKKFYKYGVEGLNYGIKTKII